MRVAVQCPSDHPVSPDAVFAYNLGRIEEGVHNAPIGHPAIPIEEFVSGLIEKAKADYPDHEVRLERLVDNGDGTGRWIPAEEFDPEQHAPVGAGDTSKAAEFSVSAGQTAGGAE